MFGFRKPPANKITKQSSVDTPDSSGSNPFDSESELDKKQTQKPARRTTSEPTLITPDFKKSNPFDDDDDDDLRGYSSSAVKNKHKNSAHSSGDLESMSVQELESYAVDKAQETTKSVDKCLRIAEDIRQDATKTLDTLHQQGEQIHRTHLMATEMERDLSKGEKILGSLGGMFSMTWKPKKGKEIKGPMTFKDDNTGGKASKEQREKLGLAPTPKGKSNSRTPPPEPTNALQQVELEKAKQDDALGDLSNILGDLKGMAVDMGSELDRQNKALDLLEDDVDELNSRVKGANQRTRKLLA